MGSWKKGNKQQLRDDTKLHLRIILREGGVKTVSGDALACQSSNNADRRGSRDISEDE